jgi:hypothetical protein
MSQLLLIKGVPETFAAHDQHGITAPVLKENPKKRHKAPVQDGRFSGDMMEKSCG